MISAAAKALLEYRILGLSGTYDGHVENGDIICSFLSFCIRESSVRLRCKVFYMWRVLCIYRNSNSDGSIIKRFGSFRT
jgi:hypothetical protein